MDPKGAFVGPPEAGELRRRLGFFDAAALHVGTILGSGIFVAPAAVAAAAPGPAGAAALWLLGGLVAACGAACYAECGTRLPRAGGFYVYYREVYGPGMAFVGGWAALAVTYPASIAAIALVFGRYLGEIVPALEGRATACAAAALLVVGAVNALGVRLAALVQRVLSGAKITSLAAVCLAALVAGRAGAGAGGAAGDAGRMAGEAASSGAGGAGVAAALLGAVVVMLWTYDGWSDIGLVAGEIRDPGRVLGRAVLLATAVLAVVYAFVQVSVLLLLGPQRAAASERVVSDAVGAGLGGGAATLVAGLVVLCTFASVHSVVLAASRLGYAMGRDGAFLRWFGRVDPHLGTPARSTAALVGATLVYVFSADFLSLLGLFSFSVWIFYAITAVALLVMRRRGTGGAAAWRAPGGWIAPVVILLTASGMTSGLLRAAPGRSLVGLALLLAGFGVYALWRRILPSAGRP